jgi:hypothetical protein
MPNDLRAVLAREADARIAGEPVPPIGGIHHRVPAQLSPQPRRLWPAPGLAVAAVIAVAAGVAQLPALHDDPARPAAIPPAPKLEPVAPPLVVAKRLGAPAGHLNGPPVASADTLAISPVRQDGLGLRTVAVVTPHAPDAAGRPRVNRCLYTYSEPDPMAMHGRCDWSVQPGLPVAADTLSLEMDGGPGQTWLAGTAPAGTAAVLLHSTGREDVVVPVADSGPAWDHRPFYVVWRSRTGTDLTAVDRAGHALARARLPSDVISRNSPADPELGTVETPLGLWERFGNQCRFRPGSPPPTGPARTSTQTAPGTCPAGMERDTAAPPARVDVLASFRVSKTMTLFRYGLIAGQLRCTLEVVRDYGADAQPGGGGGGCGTGVPAAQAPPIDAGRSYSAGTGQPQEQLINGSAPRGTVRVRLSAPGYPTRVIRAYDGGERWQHRSYFLAPWPSGPATRVEAMGNDGQTLATVVTRGLNLRAFDADFLEAEATCMERHGVEVVRTPQGPGVPPAYAFNPGSLPAHKMRSTQDSCEDEANRTS